MNSFNLNLSESAFDVRAKHELLSDWNSSTYDHTYEDLFSILSNHGISYMKFWMLAFIGFPLLHIIVNR